MKSFDDWLEALTPGEFIDYASKWHSTYLSHGLCFSAYLYNDYRRLGGKQHLSSVEEHLNRFLRDLDDWQVELDVREVEPVGAYYELKKRGLASPDYATPLGQAYLAILYRIYGGDHQAIARDYKYNSEEAKVLAKEFDKLSMLSEEERAIYAASALMADETLGAEPENRKERKE